ARIAPHAGAGGGVPSPKNDRAEAQMTACPMPKVISASRDDSVLGIRWFRTFCHCEWPSTVAASNISELTRDHSCVRIRRAYHGAVHRPTAIMAGVVPGPVNAIISSANNNAGIA